MTGLPSNGLPREDTPVQITSPRRTKHAARPQFARARIPLTEKTSRFHEHFERDETIKASSDRSFGFVFAGGFTVIAAFPLLWGGTVRLWAIGIAVVVLLFALAAPAVLAPLNRAWMRFGLLLGRIMNPIVLGIFIFGVLTPFGWFRRRGSDPLGLTFDRDARTYWVNKSPLPAGSMKRQF